MPDQPYVVNPEAIGDPNQTPVLQHSVSGCPTHSDDWLYRAVRNNRRLSGLPPQECTCGDGQSTACDQEWCCNLCRGKGHAGGEPCWDCLGTGHTHPTEETK